MKKRLIKLCVLIAVAAGAVYVAANYPFNEPRYQGRRISNWLDDFATGKETDYVTAIGEIGPAGVPFVIKRLAQNDSPVRNKYQGYWDKLPSALQKVVPAAPPSLQVVNGANAFYYVGPDAIPQVIDALRHPSVTVRESAAWGLGTLRRKSQLANQGIPALAAVFRNGDDARVQFYAALALREMGPAASNAVSVMNTALIKNGAGLSGTNAALNAAIASALGKMGPEAIGAAPSVRLLLQETNVYLRGQAAVAVWRIEGDAGIAVPVLARELSHVDENAKWDWIIALGEMGPRAKAAIPALEQQLKGNPSAENRSYLTNALAKIGPPIAPTDAGNPAGIQ